QDRAVLGDDDVVGAAGVFLVAGDPALGEDFLLCVLAVGIDRDPHDAAALVLVAVPGAVLGDEGVVLVFGRAHAAGAELPGGRRGLRFRGGALWRGRGGPVTRWWVGCGR